MTTATIDALMLEYAWTVHDFQHLAHSLSLLTAAINADEFEERNFYSDVEALTMAAAESRGHRALLEQLTAEDKAVLTRLKGARDRLVYSFFVDHRIDRDNADVVAREAREKLNALRADIKEGRKVLDRAYAILAEVGEED
ncbi:hypothetical protein [Caenispirillum salinarum]|uniref:hypothetical protein n=1 Tax=Caenispirillum salinarum TaxID=859058 RepID=UPI00384D7C3C